MNRNEARDEGDPGRAPAAEGLAAGAEGREADPAVGVRRREIFDARDRIDPAAFARSVIQKTADVQSLAADQRLRFEEVSKRAADEIRAARAHYEEGRRQLPPRDRANPGPREQASQALDTQWRESQKAAADRVRSLLNPSLPGHADFSDRAERRWRELAGTWRSRERRPAGARA